MFTTDRKTRAALAKLDGKVVDLDLAITAARDEIADVEKRIAALRERQGEIKAAAPKGDDPAEDAAADALLADPKLKPDKGFIARLTGARSKRDEQLAEHRATAKPVAAAIRKGEREIENREAEIKELEAERAKAWREFSDAAFEAGFAEYQRRAKALVDELLLPLCQFEIEGGRAYTRMGLMARVFIEKIRPARPMTGYRWEEGEHPPEPYAFEIFPGNTDLAMKEAAVERVRAELAKERG